MLMSLLRGGLSIETAITHILAILVIVFLVLPFHEWAHAFTALKLGDTSIKYTGRLTLNPLAHIDPFGALALLLFGIGWAKPVPINARNFKRPKLYMGITALMGPVANFVAALLGGLILNALIRFAPDFLTLETFGRYIWLFLLYYIQINVVLAVFNFLPIPPLDGSKILFIFLPDRAVQKFYQYERYIAIGLMLLLWLSSMNVPVARQFGNFLSFIQNAVTNFVLWLTSLPFTLF